MAHLRVVKILHKLDGMTFGVFRHESQVSHPRATDFTEIDGALFAQELPQRPRIGRLKADIDQPVLIRTPEVRDYLNILVVVDLEKRAADARCWIFHFENRIEPQNPAVKVEGRRPVAGSQGNMGDAHNSGWRAFGDWRGSTPTAGERARKGQQPN